MSRGMATNRRILFLGIDGAVPATVLRYAQEGALPHIAALLQRGVWCENCLPAFPTITPTCWATLATGATPGTHGVTCQHLPVPGQLLTAYRWSYRSETCRAERFWEAAARAGQRSLIVHYPTSGPARSAHVWQVNGTSCTALEYTPEGVNQEVGVYGVECQLFSTARPDPRLAWLELTPASGQWQGPRPGSAPQASQGTQRLLRLSVEPKNSLWRVAPFSWFVQLEGQRALLWDDLGAPGPVAALEAGTWSGVLQRTLDTDHGPHTFRYRVKVLEADAASETLSIFFTPLADFRPAVNDPALAEALQGIDEVATFSSHAGYFGSGALDDETYLEIERLNLNWQASAIQRAWELSPCAVTVGYTVMIDTINHKYRNLIEGLTGDEGARAKAIAMERQAYALVDEFVGRLVEHAGPETVVVLASDHGSVGYTGLFRPAEALKRAGLLVTRPLAEGQGEEIVWEETRAVPFGSVHIYVNLKGREPRGIVAPQDYERTVEEIIAALYDARADGGGRSVALALRRADAALVGLSGDRIGDVIWGVSGRVGGYIGGVHACQIPTASSPTGDIRSLLLLAGPGLRQGTRLRAVVHHWDVAPTLCHLLGWPMPAQAEGRVICQALA